MQTFREPRHEIKDPQDCGCYGNGGVAPEPGDSFDRFLRLTGGDPAPRGGHMDAVKAHEQRVAMPPEQINGEYYYGPQTIIAPVYRPRTAEQMHPEPTPAMQVKTKNK